MSYIFFQFVCQFDSKQIVSEKKVYFFLISHVMIHFFKERKTYVKIHHFFHDSLIVIAVNLFILLNY